ncbi:hypothetical protein [Embleya scabrispora]|uniref:hypothetical protein n=1 Tax=Embleya scabrispora TaxID=159449 RepID=UPI00037E1B16|nr:hypothetical protein [Embleya scabrispora]
MAVPHAVFVVLLRLIHTAVLAGHVIRPLAALCGAAAVLLLPPAAPYIGVAAVIAALATIGVLMVVITFPAAARRH